MRSCPNGPVATESLTNVRPTPNASAETKLIPESIAGCSIRNPASAGNAPTASEKLASPNAVPFALGKIFARDANVMDIVKLKKSTPRRPITGISHEGTNKVAATMSEKIAVVLKPMRSATIPPRALPANTPRTLNTSKSISLFQGNAIAMPA